MTDEQSTPVDADAGPATAAPVVRVIAGSPTDDELAAAHAVIAAMLAEQSAQGAELLPAKVDRWSRAQLRTSLEPGAGAWAASRGARGC